MALANSGR